VGPGSFLGSFVRPDIEHFESEVPFRVMRYEFMTDAEGAGEYRGGPGIFVEMVSEVKPGHPSFLMTGNCDGAVVAARGSTGEDLAKLEMWVESPDGSSHVLRTMSHEPVFAGEVVLAKAPGGGGWGDPLDRDARKVWEDVVDGLIRRLAHGVYGGIVGRGAPGGARLEKRRRARRKGAKDEPPQVRCGCLVCGGGWQGRGRRSRSAAGWDALGRPESLGGSAPTATSAASPVWSRAYARSG
jgi:N-methylhydantoinase B